MFLLRFRGYFGSQTQSLRLFNASTFTVPVIQNAITTLWKVLMCPSVMVKEYFDFKKTKTFQSRLNASKLEFLMMFVRGDKETGTRVIFDGTQVSRLLALECCESFYIQFKHTDFFVSIIPCFVHMSVGNLCKQVNAHFRSFLSQLETQQNNYIFL